MSSTMLVFLFFIVTLSQLDFTVAQIGVVYGRKGDNLPPPSETVRLYKQYNIKRMRIYDTNHDILNALWGSGIELTVGILNQDLPGLNDPAAWVRDNIIPFHPDVNFRHIVVGKEVRPGKGDTSQYAGLVLPAMRGIHNALRPELRDSIKVTTNVDTEILEPGSAYPPENGRFRSMDAGYIDPIVRFLAETGALLFATIYPYFAYKNNPGQIDLAYALLDPNYPGVVTPDGTRYQNLYYALFDAVNAAVEKSVGPTVLEAGGPTLEVIIGQSGEPTLPGGPGGGGERRSKLAADDVATVENVRAYVNNLIQVVKTGSPRRPNRPIQTYIFDMYDENKNTGNEEDRHFGLFLPNGQPKYPVNFD